LEKQRVVFIRICFEAKNEEDHFAKKFVLCGWMEAKKGSFAVIGQQDFSEDTYNSYLNSSEDQRRSIGTNWKK